VNKSALSKGLNEDIVSAGVSAVYDNRITGALFVSLTENDIKEPSSTIGDRIALRNILDEIHKVSKRLRHFRSNKFCII